MSDQEATLLTELGRYLDPTLETAAAPPQFEEVALDDATLAQARTAAQAPWYASWVTGAMIPGAPLLGLLMGVLGGISPVLDWSEFGLVMLFILGPIIGIIWLALFTGHRDRVAGIRQAISTQRALQVTGPVSALGEKSILVGDRRLDTVHRISVPAWARTAPCTVVFGESIPSSRRRSARNAVISVTGPDGLVIYPPAGALPFLLAVPSLIASILLSLAFTSAFNAQSQAYSDASTRLRDITNATQCSAASKPGDDCWTWMPGTITWEGGYTRAGSSGETKFSTCRTVLRWGKSRQEGDVRIDGLDCTKQLAAKALPVRIQVLHSYAIQVQLGGSTYQTDRWPPLGRTVDLLARVFQLASLLWVAWPFAHVAISIAYRVRRARSARRVGIP